jgi:hypothetical protein
MYRVVLYEGQAEAIGEAMTWREAEACYETQSRTVNAKNEYGDWVYPDSRVAIRATGS